MVVAIAQRFEEEVNELPGLDDLVDSEIGTLPKNSGVSSSQGTACILHDVQKFYPLYLFMPMFFYESIFNSKRTHEIDFLINILVINFIDHFK